MTRHTENWREGDLAADSCPDRHNKEPKRWLVSAYGRVITMAA